ncbi:MAG: hypothetical protein L6R40_006105 [Gallowayella cf. fulva]|nr:MAG: hypothetical protein L6R40_006105 [Xanthomendoza cf. fulva]
MATLAGTPQYLYKILPATITLHTPLPPSFILPRTSLDIHSGFIHFSTSSQVPYVLNRFFTTPEDGTVWLIKISYAGLERNGNVKWEEAGKDKSLFAHLYDGDVNGDTVVEARKFDKGNGWDESLRGLAEEGWLL